MGRSRRCLRKLTLPLHCQAGRRMHSVINLTSKLWPVDLRMKMTSTTKRKVNPIWTIKNPSVREVRNQAALVKMTQCTEHLRSEQLHSTKMQRLTRKLDSTMPTKEREWVN